MYVILNVCKLTHNTGIIPYVGQRFLQKQVVLGLYSRQVQVNQLSLRFITSNTIGGISVPQIFNSSFIHLF